MGLSQEWLEKVKTFRRELHKFPELSGKEEKTPQRIIRFVSDVLEPDSIYKDFGKTGLLLAYKGKQDGKNTMLRADMDALPIMEDKKKWSYASKNEGVSHKCGHDGHMAMLAGILPWIKENKEDIKGSIYLLFQPAEETGQGASWVLSDERWKELAIDSAYGLHNLPGYEANMVFYRKGVFACGSTGMIIRLKGNYAHAGSPEKGNNPDLCMAEIIQESKTFIRQNEKEFSLVTTVGIKSGEKNFGISPGKGEIYFTLRTEKQESLETLKEQMSQLAKTAAKKYDLALEIQWEESFAATKSSDDSIELLREACERKKIGTTYLSEAMRWSEDFGMFTQQLPGAFFGLGIGKDIPALHHQDYDFNDEVLESGINIWTGILEKIHLD